MPLTAEDLEKDRPCKIEGCGDRRVQHKVTDYAMSNGGGEQKDGTGTICSGCQERYMHGPNRNGERWHPDWFAMISHPFIPDLSWIPEEVPHG